jgi:hypothetical protein
LQFVTPASLRISSISASDSESQPPLEVLMMAPTFNADISIPADGMSHLFGKFFVWPCIGGKRAPLVSLGCRCEPFQIPLLSCELKRKKPVHQKQQDFHHNVYVVLLNDAVAKHPSILRLNPKRDPLKPCVYVGMTGVPVDQRFENHKNGYKSAWVVRKYGVRLMPELYEHLNPMPFDAAVQMETELAEELRIAGYTVTGGH